MAGKPPLDLQTEVTLADGTRYRWDANGPASDRPQGISFRTKKGDGFADASLTLSRHIDRDYVDLNLYDDFALVGADGSVAYEGRVFANPRSVDAKGHAIAVQLQGWMSHAKDRNFSEIYVDRNFSAWGEAPLPARAADAAGGISIGDFSWAVTLDGLAAALPNQALGAQTRADVWYAALPGTTIAKVGYIGADTSLPAGWFSPTLVISSDTARTTTDSYTLTFDGALHTQTLTTARAYALLRHYSNGSAVTPASGSMRRVSAIAIYGNHGLTTRSINSSTPDGLYASDVIKDIISRFCSKLNTSGVQGTTYAVPHLVFDDVTPFDALLDVNKYHLWNLAVYENKTLFFKPFDYTDYDWEVRLSDLGTTVDLQGDAVDQFANGISVSYTDINTGRLARLTPTDDSTLADTSSNNPANTHGLTVWTELSLSAPTDSTGAAQIGRVALAEFNQPKGPGTITVQGHIRDRAGHWQPVWKVRAGDRLIISDHPNDRVRLVNETDYNHDSKTVSIAVDQSFMRLDAVLDRVTTALAAANVG